VPPPPVPRDAGAPGGGGGRRCPDLPACLAGLASGCEPQGACQQQQSGTNIAMCYANGVKMYVTVTVFPVAAATIRLARPDGSTCYTVDLPITMGTGGTMLTYRNAMGQVVATGVSEGDRLTITCTGSGVTQVVPSSCGIASGATSGCRPGMCQ
jgi:hypothetical protein